METGYGALTSETREKLILEHLPQVRWIASDIHDRLPAGTALEDLVSAGVVGLIAAIDNFDPARNASLRTYAEYKIRGAILDSVRGLDGIPAHKRKRAREVQKAISSAEQLYGRTPGEEEVAEQLGVSIREYRNWLDETRGISLGSLDSVASEGCDVGLIRYLANSDEPASVTLEREEIKGILLDGLKAMPELEQTILDLYYCQELTLAEIGQIMGLHTSRIGQLKTQATLRLRNWMAARLRPRVRTSAT